MKNKRGFTLIELLAVITIMGILMLVAIPTVSRVIENSRRDIFVDSAKSYANTVRNMWTADEFTCNGVKASAVPDGDYYVLINTNNYASEKLPKLLESGGKSPWGNQDVNGYVRINVSTKPGQDRDGDGIFEVDPIRVMKYYVALSDGLHGVIDDGNTLSGNLSKKDVNLHLTEDDLKKIELTTDEGNLDCAYDASGDYFCTGVTPIKDITGICVDNDQTINLTGRIERLGENFSSDDWGTIVTALKSGNHPYQVGDTKTVDMGSFGTHTIRISNLSTPSECSNPGFSQTSCGVVLEFADIISEHKMHSTTTNVGGWAASSMRTYVNNDIFNALPTELRNGIIDTTVVSGHGSTAGETNFTSVDKLYLLAAKELWEEGSTSDTANDSMRQLDYYQMKGVTVNNSSFAVKKNNGIKSSWWLRSTESSSTLVYTYVSYNEGIKSFSFSNGSAGVSPAFRVA